MQGARHRAGGDRQAEAIAQEPDDLAMRQPQLLVEDDDQGEGLRPELHGGGAQGIRRLQRVAPLHAPATRRAVTDPHVEAAHARHHHRQVFLILRRYARRRHGTGTVRTRGRHRDRDDLVDAPRRGPVPVAAVARPCSAPAASWLWRGRAFRERCRLPCARPTRQVEFVLQPLVLTAQPVAVALQSDAFCFRPFKLAPQAHRLPGRWGADSLPSRLSAYRRPQPDPRECPRAGRHAPDRAQEPRHLRPLQHYSRAGTARRRGPTRRVSRATGAGGTSPPAAPPGRTRRPAHRITPPPRATHHRVRMRGPARGLGAGAAVAGHRPSVRCGSRPGHTAGPARASGAGDGFATRSRHVRAPHHLIRVPIETPACRCWE